MITKSFLSSGFKPQKIPENLDTIVIGSGIGGLTTAVLLSRAGQKVLVLEQHDQAGGCCHTFVDKGYEFDTGKLCDRVVLVVYLQLCCTSRKHAYIILTPFNLGFTGVYIIFLISTQKHGLWVLVRTASPRRF